MGKHRRDEFNRSVNNHGWKKTRRDLRAAAIEESKDSKVVKKDLTDNTVSSDQQNIVAWVSNATISMEARRETD